MEAVFEILWYVLEQVKLPALVETAVKSGIPISQ